ncbi:MAG: cadherin-like beta sandwich domain-containing protein [Eubacteriales bacterium]
MLLVVLTIILLLPCIPAAGLRAEVVVNGTVTATSANIRSAPGTGATVLVNVTKGTRAAIGNLVTISGDPSGYNSWRAVSVAVAGTQYDGYVVSSFVQIDSIAPTPTPTPTPTIDPDFENAIAGFPESYKPSLRSLHQAHPSWVFNAVNVNTAWSAVVAAESKLGTSLIVKSIDDSWKSTDTGAYNWLTNTYRIFDGTSWVNASQNVIAYYLDPRNFLGETYVFQFLNQSYDAATQTQAAVQKILDNTFMATALITDPSGASITYAQAFMQAGNLSGSSPYQLVSRVIQEVSAQGSRSTYGTEPGYQNHYNFYNIGASSSPDPVILGLTFAVNGSNNPGSYPMSPENKVKYLIPWNSQYRSIVGGAIYISANYIQKGQSTLYFQKFDVKDDGNGVYSHQYMTNIEAMLGESTTLHNAYVKSGTLDLPLTFSIPVYVSMPDTPVSQPAKTGNPNNYLTSLAVDGYALTPGFDPSVTDGYALSVPYKTSTVNISASPVSSSALLAGTGNLALVVGNNVSAVTVTAQNGSVRTYHITITRNPDPGPHVSFQTHVQDIGWQGYVISGETSGTIGQSKRLEAIRANLENVNGGIEYRTQVQDIGWMDWVADGALSGTSAQSKRLEAIRIRLTGAAADTFDVYYRVHAQEFGWLDWAKNGESAGTAGFSYRLEAIEIVLVPKGGAAPGATTRPYVDFYAPNPVVGTVSYQTHVQDIGWQGYVSNGATSGTVAQSRRLEAIHIKLENLAGGIEYRTHVQDKGWMDWVANDAMSGTSGQSKRLEAIQIRLTGAAADLYDIYYRVHAQNCGWLGWAKNGEPAGTAGYSYRLEAIEIVLIPKGTAAPGLTDRTFLQA